MRMFRFLIIISSILFCTSIASAEPSNKRLSGKDKDDFAVIMSTKFDFSETSISGEMKAPDGFYLQGRQQQSLSEMVKLRSNFKRQLRNSGAAVRSLAR